MRDAPNCTIHVYIPILAMCILVSVFFLYHLQYQTLNVIQKTTAFMCEFIVTLKKLHQAKTTFKLPVTTLTTSCPTLWWSCVPEVKSTIDNRNPINMLSVTGKERKYDIEKPTEEQWNVKDVNMYLS